MDAVLVTDIPPGWGGEELDERGKESKDSNLKMRK